MMKTGFSGGMSRGTNRASALGFTIIALLLAPACGGGGGSSDGGTIENVPREGWACGMVGEICACGANPLTTEHCETWTDSWCCELYTPDQGAAASACDCATPAFLGQIGQSCTAWVNQMGHTDSEIVDICPPAPASP